MSIFHKLGFTQKWIDLGIITPEKLAEPGIQWNKSEDSNTEHYRWRAFQDFLAERKNLESETLKELYDLGKNDSDSVMGGSMMVDILNRKECPLDLLESALSSPEKFIRKVACRKLGKEFTE